MGRSAVILGHLAEESCARRYRITRFPDEMHEGVGKPDECLIRPGMSGKERSRPIWKA
jgi:hypothetical protein